MYSNKWNSAGKSQPTSHSKDFDCSVEMESTWC